MTLLGEVKAALPGITKAIWPFAGEAVLLMPDVFLGPKPALFAKGKDEFQHVSVALTVYSLFLDVKDE